MAATPPTNDNGPATDVELQLDLDEHGRVWATIDGDCHIIGRRDAVRAEMIRFLAEIESEE